MINTNKDNKGNRILVIDDNPLDLRFLVKALREKGYAVYPAAGAELALDFVQSKLPDVILLDVNMPDMDGYQVCEQLQANEATRDVPVIFVSGADQVLDKVKAFLAGGVDYILKPYEMEEVLARIDLHLSMRQLQKNLEKRVEERTAALTAANDKLQREVEERIRAERELRQAQDELLQASKMAALRGHSDNARLLLERGMVDEAMNSLLSIAKVIDRMGNITSQLKAFSRRRKPGLAPVSLKVAIDNVLSLLERRVTDEGAQVTIYLPAEQDVLADNVRLEQVLTNLFSNALDAMVQSARRELTISVLNLPPIVQISVRDSGTGIASDVLSHLFEPFMTTKPSGKGLGLGLAISFSIVQEFGGKLTARNHPDGGAEFTIELFGTTGGTHV